MVGGAEGSSPRRIPEATVARLPVYERILTEMLRSGDLTVSSEQLGSRARVNAAKVRKDLSLLGSFGTRGTGYDIAFLVAQIQRALGVDGDWPVAVVGLGNLGRALVNAEGFSSRGFRIAGAFDIDPAVVGQQVGPVVVRHLDELGLLEVGDRPTIGVVATPAAPAQQVTDALVAVGVRAILTFAPAVLEVPAPVLLRYVDLSIDLQVMSFFLARQPAEPLADELAQLRAVGLTPRR
jgi:redox-sensing transcriptional repressor